MCIRDRHGIEDTLVNIDYSRRAQREYKNCTLVEVHGDHGFIKKGFRASKMCIRDRFIQTIADRVMDIADGKITDYKGTYDEFLETFDEDKLKKY